jgi:hypothetical protein
MRSNTLCFSVVLRLFCIALSETFVMFNSNGIEYGPAFYPAFYFYNLETDNVCNQFRLSFRYKPLTKCSKNSTAFSPSPLL